MKTISDYTISCTAEQTRKALELGAPIMQWRGFKENSFTHLPTGVIIDKDTLIFIPTAEQMRGWLRTKGCTPYVYPVSREGRIVLSARLLIKLNDGESDSFHGFGEDYSIILAAIDAALGYLLNNRNKQYENKKG